jgi:hypothetical protein
VTQHDAETPRIRAGGLVTVAFLKARLDEGNDHLSIFMPLVFDVLARLPAQSFTTTDVQEALAVSHGVAMPLDVLATLLKRATRKDYLLREAGRFSRNPDCQLPPTNVVAEKTQIEKGQERLGEALQSHAANRGMTLESADAALDLLFRFLEEEQVALLLGSPPEIAAGADASLRERAIIAEFLHDAISKDKALMSIMSGMLEGLVLYHATFLPDFSRTTRSFRDLRVVFDSILVRQAVGYEGVAMRGLMRETLDLLKASGVQCLVFDKTLNEIRSILDMYEVKLATSGGRSALWPVPMTRHFLTQRYSPSDIREMSALLEREVISAGFQIQQAPRRIEQHTSGEKALAKRLANPVRNDELAPRVMHDVDCIAGVLTLRRGHRSYSIEDARVVFAATEPRLIRNTRLWWEEDESETGIAPIVHIRALANLAWLKKPSINSNFKMRELVALCTAALRPTTGTWRRFLKHLDSLKESQRLSSDEMAAIVASAMSDRLLREAEMEEDDPSDIDAVTLDEAVERVKASYGAKAEERVRVVTDEYERKLSETAEQAQAEISRVETVKRTMAETMRRRELKIEGRVQAWASGVTRGLQWLIAGIVLVGAVALIIGHPFHGGLLGIAVGVAVIIFVGLELVGILRHVSEWRASFEVRLRTRFRVWLLGDAQIDQVPRAE